jgi:phospholipase/carboxylesterase
VESRDVYGKGRLAAKHGAGPVNSTARKGTMPVGLNRQKDTLLYVPESYRADKPAALAVMLHGAGGDAEHGLSYLQHHAEANNLILLAPASREYSWDIIATEEFGPDIILIDQALSYLFGHYSIDGSRIAVGGFSDGASYALCIGLTNGDLFTHIIAFSPGFYFANELRGEPAVFISHGTDDDVLPIDHCSRRIVQALRRENLPLLYREFKGRHEIPAGISQAALDWFFQKPEVDAKRK